MHRIESTLLAGFALVTAVALAGCPGEPPRSCSSPSDCFDGEVCVSGECRLPATLVDTGSESSDTGTQTKKDSHGPADTSTKPDSKTPPTDTSTTPKDTSGPNDTGTDRDTGSKDSGQTKDTGSKQDTSGPTGCKYDGSLCKEDKFECTKNRSCRGSNQWSIEEETFTFPCGKRKHSVGPLHLCKGDYGEVYRVKTWTNFGRSCSSLKPPFRITVIVKIPQCTAAQLDELKVWPTFAKNDKECPTQPSAKRDYFCEPLDKKNGIFKLHMDVTKREGGQVFRKFAISNDDKTLQFPYTIDFKISTP